MKIQLSVQNPCTENWDTMQVLGSSRHCSRCQMSVTDFTAMSDAEIIAFLKNTQGKVCGRVRRSQTQRVLQSYTSHTKIISGPLAALLAALAGTPATAQAQQTSYEVKTEMQCEQQISTPVINGERVDIHEQCSRRFRIIDVDTGEPLPFCMVRNVNMSYGITSDLDGFFSLDKTQAPVSPSDTLIISYVGYHSKQLSVQQLLALSGTDISLIKMDVVEMGAIVTYKRTPLTPFRWFYYKTKRILGW